MGFTTAGLTNGGVTAHYEFQYDDVLSAADGVNRANAIIAQCEQDFNLMSGWFSGVSIGTPLSVILTTLKGGASWSGSGIILKAGNGISAFECRYLLVSEVTEMFMKSQGKGWFQSGDEGSKGEGLSRFLGVQFRVANGSGAVPFDGFAVGTTWLNSVRQNFVDVAPDDNHPDPTNGCTTLFIYYLHSQLGYSINQIIAAGADTLAGVYTNLTGKNDGWTSFINLVNLHYPQGVNYNPAGDDIFPVSDLASLATVNQIVTGYSDTSHIFIDKPAMAEVNIKFTSDDPSVVVVPAIVTVPVGSISAPVLIHTNAIAIPF